ncbi:MAG TPA: hypothetical protein IGS52_06475 [Oscillatoriaceae cyanobacterium M33_DOE_052]|uniref:Uncharacterized protein n=1 Tax=Planktothricoides sp. SpSt-374 TaxID=2282167 RepID=A0A7C3VJ93_9CYAN|nr:hypothetical protein [Oscillatoriaceae cyanobacterium M33_DOE_052]
MTNNLNSAVPTPTKRPRIINQIHVTNNLNSAVPTPTKWHRIINIIPGQIITISLGGGTDKRGAD